MAKSPQVTVIPCAQVHDDIPSSDAFRGYLLRDFHDAQHCYLSSPVLQPKRVKVPSDGKILRTAAIANPSTHISALGSEQGESKVEEASSFFHVFFHENFRIWRGFRE